jgi:hypothetical protein
MGTIDERIRGLLGIWEALAAETIAKLEALDSMLEELKQHLAEHGGSLPEGLRVYLLVSRSRLTKIRALDDRTLETLQRAIDGDLKEADVLELFPGPRLVDGDD